MPDRLFRCDCGYQVMLDQPITEVKYPLCPECGEITKQVLGLSAIKFNSKGFYKTDKGKK